MWRRKAHRIVVLERCHGSSRLESANWWPVVRVGFRCVFFGLFGVGP